METVRPGGGNIGLLWVPNERHRVALTYRLPYTVDYEGDFTLAAVSMPAETAIDFPAVAVLGYAFCPTPKWTLELDVDWTAWNEVDDIVIDFQVPGVASVTQDQEFRNTLAWKLGAEYAASKQLDFRVGYIFNENATPEEVWRPNLPDTDMHFLTAGCGYAKGRMIWDAAVQVVVYTKRSIENNVDMNEFASFSSVDGTYRTWAPCISLSATYLF